MAAPWQITREMFLSVEEAGGLLGHVESRCGGASERLDRLIIEVLLFSGIRSSEFCKLTIADSVLSTGQSALEVQGNGRNARTVCVPQRVGQLIREYARVDRRICLDEPLPKTMLAAPLVVTERGRPFERTGLYRRVVRILTDAGLGDRASVQLLRHTYGYLAYLSSGGNLLFVQRQLGHAHPMITSIYAQFVDEDYEAIADQTASYFEMTPSN